MTAIPKYGSTRLGVTFPVHYKMPNGLIDCTGRMAQKSKYQTTTSLLALTLRGPSGCYCVGLSV